MVAKMTPLLALFACDSKTEVDEVVYWDDVKPVVDAYCGGCHYDGGIAPFALTTYDEVATMADAMVAAVASGRMPPWKPDDSCSSYSFDSSVPPEQLAVLEAWADAGAPEGDPADEGAPLSLDLGSMSRVDVELTMEQPYTALSEPDDYRCFVFPWEAGETYVTGFQATPGDARVVHHVIAYAVDADGLAEAQSLDTAEDGYGYTCFGGPGITSDADGVDWLGAWVPGSAGRDSPEGTGIQMDADAGVVVQIHYNTETAGLLPDQTTIAFRVDETVETPARIAKISNPDWVSGADPMEIPAGDADAMASTEVTLPVGVTIYTAGLHMHELGTSARLWATDDAGNDTCLLSIPDWDFHWQGSYRLETPVSLDAGTKISIECHWDNSDGTTDVSWGEGTDDEMCLGTAYLTLN